jgi:hypothetical protein
MFDADEALDRIAALFAAGLPDGLRRSSETLEEVQRLVRLTGREAGPQFDDEEEGPMRFLTTTEDVERERSAAWADGFGAGAIIGLGVAAAAAGAWAMLAGVWS